MFSKLSGGRELPVYPLVAGLFGGYQNKQMIHKSLTLFELHREGTHALDQACCRRNKI